MIPGSTQLINMFLTHAEEKAIAFLKSLILFFVCSIKRFCRYPSTGHQSKGNQGHWTLILPFMLTLKPCYGCILIMFVLLLNPFDINMPYLNLYPNRFSHARAQSDHYITPYHKRLILLLTFQSCTWLKRV